MNPQQNTLMTQNEIDETVNFAKNWNERVMNKIKFDKVIGEIKLIDRRDNKIYYPSYYINKIPLYEYIDIENKNEESDDEVSCDYYTDYEELSRGQESDDDCDYYENNYY